jgi:hypothetical protein
VSVEHPSSRQQPQCANSKGRCQHQRALHPTIADTGLWSLFDTNLALENMEPGSIQMGHRAAHATAVHGRNTLGRRRRPAVAAAAAFC